MDLFSTARYIGHTLFIRHVQRHFPLRTGILIDADQHDVKQPFSHLSQNNYGCTITCQMELELSLDGPYYSRSAQ